MYKTELHAHTSTVSACGRVTPEELVEKYIEAGYTTLVLTDHINFATFDPQKSRYTGSADWEACMDHYDTALARARAAARDRLYVLQGCEIAPREAHSDFLVYGVDTQFYRGYPDLIDTKHTVLIERVHEAGGLIYQAHPFRNGATVTKPSLLDGIETFNGHPGHDSRNDVAALWAARFSLAAISGSDLHHPPHKPAGGILTEQPITTMAQLVSVLRSGSYTLICDEDANASEYK